MNVFGTFCDDFFVDMHVNTEMDMPSERDTVLAFCERIKRQFPGMGNFGRKETGDFCLEEEREGERYRWVSLEMDRICAVCENPMELEEAYELQRLVLELAPYMLGLSYLDISSLDVTFTMDFDYRGNHNEIVSDAFFSTTAFAEMFEMPGAKPVGFSPSVVIALSEDCRRQARIAIEPRTSVYEVRNNKYKSSESISLYFTVRSYPDPADKFDAVKSFASQCRQAEELMAEKIIPCFANPLISAIAQRRSI